MERKEVLNTTNTTNLTVKEVDIFGDTVVAAQDKDGTIWAGVRWICAGIGLSDGQSKSERKKIQEDLVISQGGRNFVLNKGSGEREVLCLQLDYIPLWLAKISITPKMKENNPGLVEKLVKYQLKAKDVLAAAFLPEKYNNTNNISNGQHSAGYKHQENTVPVQPSNTAQPSNKPDALDFHGSPVITTSELARHYGIPYQNVLTTFYRHKEHFDKGIHYFLLEMDEEIEFRKMNGLNTATKLYLWTRKGSLMFTKIINNDIGWKQYKNILDILFQKTYGDDIENSSKDIVAGTDCIQQPLAICEKHLKPQNNWYLKNSYKIERICKALDIKVKEFNHLVIAKIQEKYDMAYIGELYKDKNGSTPEYALDIINYFPELSEIADNVLYEFMFSIIDRFSLVKNISSIK